MANWETQVQQIQAGHDKGRAWAIRVILDYQAQAVQADQELLARW